MDHGPLYRPMWSETQPQNGRLNPVPSGRSGGRHQRREAVHDHTLSDPVLVAMGSIWAVMTAVQPIIVRSVHEA